MKDTKKSKQITQLIIRNLIEIIELYDIYRISQHFSYITDKEGFYYWTDEKLLGELEKYKDKLDNEYDDTLTVLN